MSPNQPPGGFQMVGARDVLEAGQAHIEEQIVALESAVASNPGLAFDLAKTLLESTCKTVLKDRGCEYDANWDLPRLLKETLSQLRLVPEQVDDVEGVSDSLRKTTGGLQTIIQGICELRNTQGFASHGKGPSFQQLEPVHALLVARAADAIVHFIFSAHRFYEASAPSKPPSFEDNPKFNDYVDEVHDTVRICDLEYRPSEVLFQVDPQAYQDRLAEFEGEADAQGDEAQVSDEAKVPS